MANPQITNGYTAIANEILERLCLIKLTDYESRILHTLWRKTYGWNKKEDVISLSQWANATNISVHHVPRTLQLLEQRNLITINHLEPKVIQYQFQKNYELWDKLSDLDIAFKAQIAEGKTARVFPNQVVPSVVVPNEVVPNQVLPNEDSGSTQPGTQVVPNQGDTKATIQKQYTKTNTTKANDDKVFVVPSYINHETWAAYLDVRRTKKAASTINALNLVVKKLEKLKAEGNDPNAVIEQSVLSGWSDIYPLKGNKGKEPQGDRGW